METTISNIHLPENFDQFLKWEPNDGFKYEWNDGDLIKFQKMNKKHLKLIRKLLRLFDNSMAYEQGGVLTIEQDIMLTGIQLRRPDLAYFSNSQIENADTPGTDEPIPEFAIEVISTTDQILLVKAKLKQYFLHGIKVVWLIYPDDKLVEVYTDYKKVQICSDKDICSAKPVLDDFEIAAEDLFS
jgi:Uma2 family endonuclease